MLLIKALNKESKLIEEFKPDQWFNAMQSEKYQYVGTIYKSDDVVLQSKTTQSLPSTTVKRGCGCGKKK
jgi:hypothetical protein